MQTEPISSLEAFISLVLKYRDTWSRGDEGLDIWFRGIKHSSYPLLPGAYRTKCDEKSMFLSFKAAAPSYIMYRPGDDWEWYVLGQHYGLPTRLLDWTESPLFALYFALTEKGGKCAVPDNPTDLPCVWIIDPGNLNKATFCLQEPCLFIPDEKRLKYWLPTECERGGKIQTLPEHLDLRDNANPVAVYPVRYNARIVAQRGVFTIHGVNDLPIDEVYRVNESTDESRIAKIPIAQVACERMFKDLQTIGVNQTSLFPEPESVTSDVKRFYGVK